ncbi:MAG: hypothetical protein HQL61_02790 [Magnetococcales bacterium]|nr:hypothetical protein [Nitrospirota bacterium]
MSIRIEYNGGKGTGSLAGGSEGARSALSRGALPPPGAKKKQSRPLLSSCNKELSFHGESWNSAHGGYFSDPAVTIPLIDKLTQTIHRTSPDVVADLGGGTGYVLQRLRQTLTDQNIRLVNVDTSEKQLQANPGSAILTLNRCLSDVKREDLIADNGSLLFVMRSVLHYFGAEGLLPLLKHLRLQIKPGEYFIHQTACFEDEQGKEIMNLIFSHFGVDKWFPTVAELTDILQGLGWAVRCVEHTDSLLLTSEELSRRYLLDAGDVEAIVSDVTTCYGDRPGVCDVFVRKETGFDAFLHYKVFECQAV